MQTMLFVNQVNGLFKSIQLRSSLAEILALYATQKLVRLVVPVVVTGASFSARCQILLREGLT